MEIGHIKENSDLIKALVTVQESLITLPMDSDNPFFNSKYLGLASILHAAKPLLTANGIAFVQRVAMKDDNLSVTTELLHQNGEEFLSSVMEMPIDLLSGTKNFMQAIGAAITYMRRYQAVSILGLVGDDDDDGNSLNETKAKKQPEKKNPPVKKPDDIAAKMEEGRRNISQLIEDNRDALDGTFIAAMVDNYDSAKTPGALRETWVLLKKEIARVRSLEQKDREAKLHEEINSKPDEFVDDIPEAKEEPKGELTDQFMRKTGLKKATEEPEEEFVEQENELDIY